MNTDKKVGKVEMFLSFGSLIVVLVIWELLNHYNVPLRGLFFLFK